MTFACAISLLYVFLNCSESCNHALTTFLNPIIRQTHFASGYVRSKAMNRNDLNGSLLGCVLAIGRSRFPTPLPFRPGNLTLHLRVPARCPVSICATVVGTLALLACTSSVALQHGSRLLRLRRLRCLLFLHAEGIRSLGTLLPFRLWWIRSWYGSFELRGLRRRRCERICLCLYPCR